MIEIVLLGPPRGKERVRFNRTTGTAFTPKRTVEYEGRLAYAAQQAMAGRPPLTGALRVTMTVKMPIAASWPKKRRESALSGELRPTGKPDADNFAKGLDSLNQIVWVDDAQIVDLRVIKIYTDQPGVWVRVEQTGGVFE